jgi:hypothetical protein
MRLLSMAPDIPVAWYAALISSSLVNSEEYSAARLPTYTDVLLPCTRSKVRPASSMLVGERHRVLDKTDQNPEHGKLFQA